MAKNKKVVTVDENKKESVSIEEKQHLGNIKLSDSKKAAKVHIFDGEKKYVIPLKELSEKNVVGRVYEYIDGKPEICGEIYKARNQEAFYTLNVKSETFLIKSNYIALLLNNTNLTLGIYKEV